MGYKYAGGNTIGDVAWFNGNGFSSYILTKSDCFKV